MGDDTWMSLFPDSFESNMTFPYDSFNVEDVHTGDEGVIAHLFSLLQDKSKPFDFLVGHFLGVDHVGHLVGPDHPRMKAKLEQMNEVLTRVVELLDDDTLLVLLGDHGMDQYGNHGGYSVLETSSAFWFYSKEKLFTQSSPHIPSGLLQYRTFPNTKIRHRSVQQIDIVPTLSLLLGLPIPYNNLGSVIPELFWRDAQEKTLERALELNSAQIKRYLDTYRSGPSGRELDDAWQNLHLAWTAIQSPPLKDETKLISISNYNRAALKVCRAMWAQFNPLLIGLGLSLLGTSLCATWAAYQGISNAKLDWEDRLEVMLSRCTWGAAVGAAIGLSIYVPLIAYHPGISIFDCALFASSLASCMSLISYAPPLISVSTLRATPVILVLHALAFLSNSFTLWEDRVVPFLLVSSIVPYTSTGLAAQQTRPKYRIIGFSFIFAVCVRLMAISTVCREEQQPYCHVTFYASSSRPTPPSLALGSALPVAVGLPLAVKRFLMNRRSNMGLSKSFIPFILTPSLVGGYIYWTMEWANSDNVLEDGWTWILRVARTCVTRSAVGWVVVAGGGLWWTAPLCMDTEIGPTNEGEGIGFLDASGSHYLLFWTIPLALVYLTTQLTGQLVLALLVLAMLSFLEVLDSVREVNYKDTVPARAPFQFADVTPFALLGLQAFYATGHQSTLSSIQWKSAFVLTSNWSYVLSPPALILNMWGPIFLMGLAVPLLVLWSRTPLSTTESFSYASAQRNGDSILASLGMMIYYAALLLGTAVSATILRRHVMVWTVFAPRFMTAAVDLVVVDLALAIGVGLGMERIGYRAATLFRGLRGKSTT